MCYIFLIVISSVRKKTTELSSQSMSSMQRFKNVCNPHMLGQILQNFGLVQNKLSKKFVWGKKLIVVQISQWIKAKLILSDKVEL